jgi:uridine kinase
MIIAIAGVSRAGKSTLAGKLRGMLGSEHTVILCQDDFVRDVECIPKIKDHIDWEHPESIEHDKLREAIVAESFQNKYVIVEGLLILWDEQTRLLFDKCFFIEIDKETFVSRKKLDDRWGIEPDWYIEHIWQSYKRFGQLPDGMDCLRLNGCRDIDEVLLMSHINGSYFRRTY